MQVGKGVRGHVFGFAMSGHSPDPFDRSWNQRRLTFSLDADGNVSDFTVAGILFERSAVSSAK